MGVIIDDFIVPLMALSCLLWLFVPIMDATFNGLLTILMIILFNYISSFTPHLNFNFYCAKKINFYVSNQRIFLWLEIN